MESAFAQGHVLAAKYRLTSCIGQGGMGEVWRARHLALNSDVAIKFIRTELAGAEDIAGRFMREAQAAAALRSPHVVQIFDYGVDGTLAYMVMELLEGESLAQRVRRQPVPLRELSRIMTQVARALSKAHEAGIVHRDLKPDNIFLTHPDGELVAKVLDFGIAKFRAGPDVAPVTATGAIMGTPHYMSPEQVQGNQQVDLGTDIWALGVIACESLTGRRPFDSDAFGDLLLKVCAHPLPVPSRIGQVPPGFDAWFARAVNRDRSQRFASAKEAADGLARLDDAKSAELAGAETMVLGTTAPTGPDSSGPSVTTSRSRTGPADPLTEPVARRSRATLIVGFCLLAALAGAVVYRMASPDVGQKAPASAVAPPPAAAVAPPPASPVAPPPATAVAAPPTGAPAATPVDAPKTTPAKPKHTGGGKVRSNAAPRPPRPAGIVSPEDVL
jgi:serine/threonine protein kinase